MDDKGYFSILKSYDEYIQFIFITGVSKFHEVSTFSDLNQLMDISLSKQYAWLCGITDTELKHYFEIPGSCIKSACHLILQQESLLGGKSGSKVTP